MNALPDCKLSLSAPLSEWCGWMSDLTEESLAELTGRVAAFVSEHPHQAEMLTTVRHALAMEIAERQQQNEPLFV